jgi:hypothetical protein
MASLIKANAQKLTHDNFATSTTASTRTLPDKTHFILISNPDASIALKVSFDGGTTFFTIPAGQSLSLDVDNFSNRNTSLKVKSASGTPNCEIIYGSEV